MKPVYQTRFGKDGNCWAACLATVFGVDLSEVNHCSHTRKDGLKNTDRWLKKRGIFCLDVLVNSKSKQTCFAGECLRDGDICILGIRQKTEGLNHAVVIQFRIRDGTASFDLIHDPMPHYSGFSLERAFSLVLFLPIPKNEFT